MIVLACHIIHYANGLPAHGTGMQIADYLDEQKKAYIFFKHPLFLGYGTRIETSIGGNISFEYQGKKNLPLLLRNLQDVYLTIHRLYREPKPVDLFIGIDPINGLIGIFLKKIGWTKKTVFYAADYAENRFANPLLNWLYQTADYMAAHYSDETWSVSSRIDGLRGKQGIPQKKRIVFPNAPLHIQRILPAVSKVKRFELVIVSNLSFAYIDFPEILKMVQTLGSKYPKLRLHIIGSGGDEAKIKDLVIRLKLQKNVTLHGSLPHDQVMAVLQTCAVGLALYNNSSPWAKWGDSMKIREYLSVGLPVVTTPVPSTADDIIGEDVGFVIKNVAVELPVVIEKVFRNPRYWNTMRHRALQFSYDHGIEKILDNRLSI